MNPIQQNELVVSATNGNKEALQAILEEIQDLVFNLSLRMLGNTADAQDASQDILIKIITRLDSFSQKSSFQTWVYRIAVNYLIDYKKSMFAQHPLNFEFYAADTQSGFMSYTPDMMMGKSEDELAWELRMSCTNVMLQCFDPETRCIFILGTMFHLDSTIVGEIFDITPATYRQKLSRARKKMADFLSVNCGLTETGCCNCKKRIGNALIQHRLDPTHMLYQHLDPLDHSLLQETTEHMVEIDKMVPVFEDLPNYHSPIAVKEFITDLLNSNDMKAIQRYKEKIS